MERSQYGLQVVRVACAAAMVVFAAFAEGAEPGEKVAFDLQQNTVRIETRIGDEPPEVGFGFIVGEDEGTVYAVTAYHVVSSEEVGADPPVVRVKLFRHQGKWIDAEVLDTYDPEHDLAVITFEAPKGFQWNKECLGSDEDENRSTRVWYAGKLAEWKVPAKPGIISSEEPDDWEFEIEDLGVQRGSSGGPLIAASGIVGMVLTDSDDSARALSIRYIQSRLKKWRHPFDLESASAPKAADATPEDPVLAKGAAIAARDAYFAPLRELLREGPERRGFDQGMVIAENHTQWGSGKQKRLDELSGDEREGFRIGATFAVDRNMNNDRAARGMVIAKADPVVAAARAQSPDPRYWLGFDIGSSFFGDRKLGGDGNTATGTGSLGVRDSLMTPEAQRGFNASSALHFSRRY